MARGTLWCGVYCALVLLPLALAAAADPIARQRHFLVELGAATGLVAFALIVIEFALVARLRAVSAAFGTDVLALFHRHMGLAALGFVVVHVLSLWGRGASLAALDPFAGPAAARSGAIAFLAFALLVVTSVARRALRLPYEPWQVVHQLLAMVGSLAMMVHVLAIGGYAADPIVRLALIGYVAFFLALLARYRLLRPLLLWRRPWEVAWNQSVGGDTRVLSLRPLGHDGVTFEPGQFVWLITGRSPFSLQQHPITIASSAERRSDGSLELAIKALGNWSRTVVPALPAGERLWVDGPFGAFTPDRAPAQGFVLIAGGIGITPMRSILLSMRDRGDVRPVLLVHAASRPTRAVFVDELADLERRLALRVVHVYEEPPAGWEGERGFVTADLLRRHLPVQWRHYQFFVCGPGPMMRAMERVLLEIGVPPARVHTERFDMV